MKFNTKYALDQMVNFEGKPARIAEIHIRVKSNAILFWKDSQVEIRYTVITKSNAQGANECEIFPWDGEFVEIKIGNEIYQTSPEGS